MESRLDECIRSRDDKSAMRPFAKFRLLATETGINIKELKIYNFTMQTVSLYNCVEL